MLSPAKMKIIKVTTRTSLEKKILRALHDHSEIEFIDVEKKGLGSGAKISESDLEKEALSLLGKVSTIVDSFNLYSPGDDLKRQNLDFEDISQTIDACRKVYERTSPDYEEITNHISEAQRKITELSTLIETSKILKPLNIEFHLVGEGKYFNILTGSIGTDKIERLVWNLKELTDDSIIIHHSEIEDEKNLSALVIGTLHKYTDDINRILASFGFVELSIPADLKGHPEKFENESQSEIEKLKSEIENWETKKVDFIQKNTFDLLSVKEQLTLEKERIEAKRMMRVDKYVLQFWAYLPASDLDSTEKLIKSVDPEAIFEIEEKEFHDDKTPTKLSNNKYIGRPYEPMVTLYGTPDYHHDFDPSTLIAFTFPIFFGIMFADIFHGFLLILLGFLAMRMKPMTRQPIGMVDVAKDYLQKGSFVIFVSGIFSFIFGFLFWSFAGLHGYEAPSFMQPGGLLWPLHFLWLFSDNTQRYSNFAHSNGQFLFLQLSLVIAIIHITVALFLLLINKIRLREYKEAVLFPGMLLIAYISASLMVFSWGLNFVSWFNLSEKPSLNPSHGYFNAAILNPILPYGTGTGIVIPKILSVIMVVAIIIFIAYEMITMGAVDGISLAADFAISLLGNTVSYARLFAINIVHAVLATLVFLVVGESVAPMVIPFDWNNVWKVVGEHGVVEVDKTFHVTSAFNQIMVIIGFLVGTILVITFELMVTFLQALRLHIVEFFSKMHFSGTGKAFIPFKSNRIYTKPVSLATGKTESNVSA